MKNGQEYTLTSFKSTDLIDSHLIGVINAEIVVYKEKT